MRERNEIWDALTLHFGPVRSPQARGMRAQAVKELTEGRYTPEEIAIGYEWVAKTFNPFTEMALAKYIDRALHEHAKSGNVVDLATVRRMAGSE